MHIPPGFTTVFPYIFATDAHAYLDFLVDGLGGEITEVTAGPDGVVRNAQVRFGDTTLMVSEAIGDRKRTHGTYYRYVENADTAMAQAVAAGGVVEMETADMPYGDRQGGIIDPNGNIWWLSQRLKPGPY
jgi:uncharacterized glyoxalase superfamily protein PhnB